MALAVVQHNLAIHGNTVPGAITLSGAPAAGNLLIAFIGCNISAASITIGTGWTIFDAAYQSGNDAFLEMTALYRYAQIGDTATLPAFWSAGTTYWSHSVYEISGVSGSWNNDLLTSIPMGKSQATLSLPQIPIFASGLALTGFARYNGNANPTLSGSWTLDDVANNNSNFGSAGGAHRAVSNGDAIDGAWSGGGTTTPVGACMVILTAARPATGKPVIRHIFGYGDINSFPGAKTPPWTPKQGCLQICYLFWSNGAHGDVTINASDWSQYATATLSSNKVPVALQRYAGAGETAIKAPATAGGPAAWYVHIVELDNVSGTFGSDHASNKVAAQASGASLTTTSDTTTAADQLALLAYGNYNGAGNVTTTGFAGYLQQFTDNGDYGSLIVAFKWFASAGSMVQGTITPNNTATAQSYNQDIFYAGSASTETGTGKLALSGISFAAAGERKETGAGGLALSPVAFGALGKRGPAGHATLALQGVSIAALGFDLGKAGAGVRQFWAF